MPKFPSRAAALAAGVLALLAGITCTDATSPRGRIASIALVPTFSQAALRVLPRLAAFEFAIDNVRLRLVRANQSVAIDTVVAVAPGQETVAIAVTITVERNEETLQALIQIRDGEEVLFEGVQSVIARAGGASTTPPPVEMEYAGPGAETVVLNVDPDTTILVGTTAQMRFVALDANQQVVEDVPIDWSLSDATMGTITGAGVFTGSRRGSVTITAETPSGVSGAATVNVTAAPSLVALVSGGNQTGAAGSALPQPIVVEVRATDNLPVPGHPVSFTVTAGGGSVAPTSTVTDQNGRASTILTLGTSAGSNGIQVLADGLAPISVSATATAGSANQLAVLTAPSTTARAGIPLAQQPAIQVRDGFGNAFTTAGLQITASVLGEGHVVAGTTTVATDNTGTATFTDLEIRGQAGAVLLRFTLGETQTQVNAGSITLSAGHARVLFLIQQPSASATSGVALASQPSVQLRDAFGNPVPTAGVPVDAALEVADGRTVGGTTTVSTDAAGVAAFPDLVISGAAGTVRLVFTGADSLAAVVSNQITLSATAPGPGVRHWIAATNGEWENPANWSGGFVPGPQDTVIVSQNGAYVVSLTSSASVARLTVGSGVQDDQQILVVGGTGQLTVADSVIVRPQAALMVSGPTGTTSLTAGAITVFGTMQWISGDIAGTENLEILPDGVLSLAGGAPMTLRGRQLLNNGFVLLSASAGGALLLSEGAFIDNGETGEIDVTGDLVISQGAGASGSIVNHGMYRKLPGSGTGSHSVGVTFVNEGSLEVYEGSIAFTIPMQNRPGGVMRGMATFDATGTLLENLGAIAPGLDQAPGTLTMAGPVNLLSVSAVSIDLGGTTAGTGYDVLHFTGAVQLGGALTVSLINGYQPALGDSLTVVRYVERSGTFATLNLPTLGGGMFFDPLYTATGLSLVVRESAGADVTWTNAAGGNWSVGSNWSTGIPPTPTQIVAIDLDGTYTITLDVDATVAELRLGAATGAQTLAASARTLTINGNTTIAPTGTLSLVGSTLAGTGTVTNAGALSVQGSTIQGTTTVSNQGVVSAFGTSAILGALSTNAASQISLVGQPATSTSALTIAQGFTNNGQLTLGSTGGHAATLTVTSGTLINAPTASIVTSGSGTRTLTTQLDNQGTLAPSTALTLAGTDVDHVNSGTIDLTLAELTVNQTAAGSFTNVGTVTLATNRDWNVTGGTLDLVNGVLAGPTSARLVMSNGTLAFTPASVGLVPLTLTSTAIAGGAVTVANGETVTLRGGGLGDPVTVESGGTLLVLGAVTLTSTLDLPTGSTLRLLGQPLSSTAALTLSTSVTNSGTIELTSTGGHAASLTMPTGTLVNASGGMIRSLASGSRTLAVQLDNQGTLDVDAALVMNRAESDHVNTGTIDLTAADLTVTQTGTSPTFMNDGAILLGASRELNISAGLVDIDGGTISGPLDARLIVSNGQLAFTTASVGLLPVTLTNTTIVGNLITIPTGQTLTLRGGEISAADVITVQSGSVLLLHGAITMNGAINLPGGSTMRLMGQPLTSSATVTVNSNVLNNGTIELTSTGGHAATLSMPTTTLTNSGSASIRSLTSGTRQLNVELDNQGTLEVDAALTINRPDADHLNSGTIDLTTADLTVTQSGTATPTFFNVGTVTLGAGRDWTVTGGTLDIDGGIVNGPVDAQLVVSDATLAFTTANIGLLPLTLTNTTIAAGSVTIPAGETLTLRGGTLINPVTIQSGGTLLLHGTVALNEPVTMPGGSVMRLMGQPLTSSALVTIEDSFTNNGTIELTSTGGHASSLNMPAAILTNSATGQIRSVTTGSRSLNVALINEGLLEVDNALTINRPDAVHTNTGTIDVTGADLTITQTGTTPAFTNFNTGVVTLGAGRDWTVTGGMLDIDEGTVQAVDSTARLVVNDAALQFTTANVTVPMTLTNTVANGGTVTIPSGQRLVLRNGGSNDAINVQPGGRLDVWGTVSLGGAISLPATGTLRLFGQPLTSTSALTLTQTLTNNGVIELRSSGGHAATLTMPPGATLINAPGGQIASLDGGTRTLAIQLDNQGIFDVNAALTLNRSGAVHTNTGTIDLTNASLTLGQTGSPQSFTNFTTGVVTVGASEQFLANAASLDIDEGTFTGDPSTSRLIVNNGQIEFSPATTTIPLTLSNTTVVGGQVNVQDGETLTLRDATLNDAIDIDGGGLLRILGSTTLGGAVTIPGGDVQILGQPLTGTGALTVTNGFTNQGVIELTSTGGHASNLTVTNGTLVNAPGGELRSLATGTRNLFAQLDNQGLFQVDNQINLNRAGAQHVNSAIINVAGGNLDIPQTGTSPSFTNNGSISVATGSQLGITGGAVINADGAFILGTGTISLLNTALVNGGTLLPAGASQAGTLTIAGGSWSNETTGTLDIEIGGSAAGTFDRLVASPGTLGGNLAVSVINGFNPTQGQQFTIITGNCIGDFASVTPGWTAACTGTSVVLTRQ